jgi:hypothetical protein
MQKKLQEFIKELMPSDFPSTIVDSRLNEMIDHLNKHSPSYISTLTSKHYSETYKSDIRNGAFRPNCFASHLIGYVEDHIKLTSFHPYRKTFWEKVDPGKNDLEIDKDGVPNAVKRFFYLNYMPFKFFAYGNCAERSSYAAVKIYDVLSQAPTDIKIFFKSYTEQFLVDHFVLRIGNEDKGWFIYDPLTNPEIIFEESEYHRDIIPLFKKHDSLTTRSICLEITPYLVERCNDSEVGFYNYFNERLSGLTEKSLKENIEYVFHIDNHPSKTIDSRDISQNIIEDLICCLRQQSENLTTGLSI